MGFLMFLLGHWKKIALVLMLAGVWFHGDRNGSSRVQVKWDAEVAEANLKAITEKARLDAENAAKDAAQAAHTRDLEADYAKKLQAADAGRDAFAKRLRDAQARYSRCELSATAPNSSGSTGGSTGSDGGYGGIDIEGAQRLRAVGIKLQETVKLCHAWAKEVGR